MGRQGMIWHATAHGSADLLFSVKVIWEYGIDLARLVECLYFFRREHAMRLRWRTGASTAGAQLRLRRGSSLPVERRGQVSHGAQFLLPCADGTKLLRDRR